MTLPAEEGHVSLWKGQDLIEQWELMDEDLRAKLGTENLKLKPKAFAWNS